MKNSSAFPKAPFLAALAGFSLCVSACNVTDPVSRWEALEAEFASGTRCMIAENGVALYLDSPTANKADGYLSYGSFVTVERPGPQYSWVVAEETGVQGYANTMQLIPAARASKKPQRTNSRPPAVESEPEVVTDSVVEEVKVDDTIDALVDASADGAESLSQDPASEPGFLRRQAGRVGRTGGMMLSPVKKAVGWLPFM